MNEMDELFDRIQRILKRTTQRRATDRSHFYQEIIGPYHFLYEMSYNHSEVVGVYQAKPGGKLIARRSNVRRIKDQFDPELASEVLDYLRSIMLLDDLADAVG